MKYRVVGIFIFLVGLLILSYPHLARYVNDLSQQELIQTYYDDVKINKSNTATTGEKKLEKLQACNRELFEQAKDFTDPFIENAENNISPSCGEVTLDDGVIGVLEIPKLESEEPIYFGATTEILDVGVGQLEGSSLPIGGESTHTILAGHRGLSTRQMFRNMDQLEVDDIFIIRTISGNLNYRVTGTKIILPDETDTLVIQPDTLFTCTPLYSNANRLLVYGERAPDEEVALPEQTTKMEVETEDKAFIKYAIFIVSGLIILVATIRLVKRYVTRRQG